MFVIFGESFLGLKKFLLKNPDGISKVFGAHKLQSSHLDFRTKLRLQFVMDSIQTFKETSFPVRPYILMADSCNETHGSYEQEIVSNKNTGEELLIRTKITRTESLLEIYRGAKGTSALSVRPLPPWSLTTRNGMP